jgi:hypothetical protein
MRKSPFKYQRELDNIFFLARLGTTLRWLSSDIVHRRIPSEMCRILREIERDDAPGQFGAGGGGAAEV